MSKTALEARLDELVEIAVEDVQVRATDAAGLDLEEDLARRTARIVRLRDGRTVEKSKSSCSAF